jgi:hypothetical protein
MRDMLLILLAADIAAAWAIFKLINRWSAKP